MKCPLRVPVFVAVFVVVSMTAPARGASSSPPSLDELRSATYTGIEGLSKPVTLGDGKWEDTPNRIAVLLVPDFRVVGDVDGAAPDDAVVILVVSRGGSGAVSHAAVVARLGDKVVNVGTAPIGDRVQLRDIRIENRRIIADVVQAGPDDAMCCPGELATRAWKLDGAKLSEVPAQGPTSRLSLATLGDRVWVLRSWDFSEGAPATPEVTLQVKDGRLSGSSGCNGYSATATPGQMPGDVRVGAAAGTRKMCGDAEMQVERRFLANLGHVTKYGFMLGQLGLTYQVDKRIGLMLFSPKP